MWTQQQQEAIDTRNCGLIVSAAAGSGKTSVLVERLVQLIIDEKNPLPVDRMVIVTFTNNAAAEMRTRLYQALDKQIRLHPENRWLAAQQVGLQNAHISTISSFCFDLIRDNLHDDVLTAGFRILSEIQVELIYAQCAETLLNKWHEERKKDMEHLMDIFCYTNDKPIQEMLIQFHLFFTSVTDKTQWKQEVLANLQKPAAESVYLHAFYRMLRRFFNDLRQKAHMALRLATECFKMQITNKAAHWIQEDYDFFDEMLHLIDEKAEPEKLSARFDQYTALNRKTFSAGSKKDVLDPEKFEDMKERRTGYAKLYREKVKPILSGILAYFESDRQIHLQILPLLFEMELQFTALIGEEKRRLNGLSFEDAEEMALDLLSERIDGRLMPSALAKELQTYYQLIMIDEYQDSNNKQDCIFKLLSHHCLDQQGNLRFGDNVFLVGDIKQAIYGFRNANPMNFTQAVAAAQKDGKAFRQITLNRNFRSTPAVLGFANFIFGNLMRMDCGGVDYDQNEALEPGADYTALTQAQTQTQIAVMQPDNEQNKYAVTMNYVIAAIRHMIAQGAPVVEKDGSTRPCTYRDFCILLRTNALMDGFAHALESAGIPVETPDESGYLRAREVAVLIDMLRVLDNPTLDSALAAVLLSPMFSLTPDDLLILHECRKRAEKESESAVSEAAENSDTAQHKKPKKRKISLYGAMQRIVSEEQGSEVLRRQITGILQIIGDLQRMAGTIPLDALIRHIYDRTDFLSVMRLTEDGSRKQANLLLLLRYAVEYESDVQGYCGLSGFLRFLDRLTENGKDLKRTSLSMDAENMVGLKTIHASKGMEFPFVFLPCTERKFQNTDSKGNLLLHSSGLAGFKIADPANHTKARTVFFAAAQAAAEEESISEEMRLLYVAMTRARQQIFIPLQMPDAKMIARYAESIDSTGRIPAWAIRSASSMADWLWAALTLLHDEDLDSIIDLPPRTWQPPAWQDNLFLHYSTYAAPEQTEENVQAQAVQYPDPELVQDIERQIAFTYENPDTNRESLLSVSAVLREQEPDRATLRRRPSFMQEKKLTGAERGTAIHIFFQYVSFQAAQEDFEAERARLTGCGLLTAQQAEAVTRSVFEAFLQDSLYARIRVSRKILRERKFLVRCTDLQPDDETARLLGVYSNASTLLKGIIDLAFLEENEWVLVDYKTDYAEEASELAQEYRPQLLLYRCALQSITGQKVKECWLYSTHLRRGIRIV